jgi:transposase
VQLQQRIQELDGQVEKQIQQRPQALRLLTHPGVGPVTALVRYSDQTELPEDLEIASGLRIEMPNGNNLTIMEIRAISN